MTSMKVSDAPAAYARIVEFKPQENDITTPRHIQCLAWSEMSKPARVIVVMACIIAAIFIGLLIAMPFLPRSNTTAHGHAQE
jgi:hypothetical protein